MPTGPEQQAKTVIEGALHTFGLGFLLFHQTHHRGQMIVLMRQAGLNVPGIYGPAHEEWAAYGMQSPDV